MAFTTVFLSLATYTASNRRWLCRHTQVRAVGVSGNSSRVAASDTKRRSTDSGPRTSARSGEQSDPASSSLPRSPTRRPRAPRQQPVAEAGMLTDDRDVPAAVPAACVWGVSTPVATDTHFAESPRAVSQFPLDQVHHVARPAPVDDGEQDVRMSHMVSCAQYSTQTTIMNFGY